MQIYTIECLSRGLRRNDIALQMASRYDLTWPILINVRFVQFAQSHYLVDKYKGGKPARERVRAVPSLKSFRFMVYHRQLDFIDQVAILAL